METFLTRLEQAVWSWPLLVLILGTGLYLTVRLRGIQLRRLPAAIRLALQSSKRGEGVSAFGALCTSLAATIGTGNIVGTASAISIGGAGALFWMEFSALTGMAVKYAEGYLAVRYRFRDPDGRPHGGPFAYARLGLGREGRVLAIGFALFGAAAGLLGVGSFVQIGSVTSGLRFCLAGSWPAHRTLRLFGRSFPILLPVFGLLLTAGAAILIFGGIRRISRFSSVLVPVMGLLYIGCCLIVLLRGCSRMPAVFSRIFREAFKPEATVGGILGTVSAGVSRGVFSNEAGLGTSPIAAACAETESPEEQGLISMTAAFFDTILICTMTGLVILVTGADRTGAGMWSTFEAFVIGLPVPDAWSRGAVLLCLCLFAFTTVVSWSYYGTECLGFLTKDDPLFRRIYLILYVLTVFLAPYLPVRSLWSAANICNGLMAVPNLLAILLLSPVLCLDVRGIINYGRDRNEVFISGRQDPRLHQAGWRSIHGCPGRPARSGPGGAWRPAGKSTDCAPVGSSRQRRDPSGQDLESGV